MCELARSRLIAWIDGELEGAEALAVSAHVESCPACQGEARAIRSLSRDIGEYARAVTARPRPASYKWLAAAAVVVLSVGLMWIRPEREPAVSETRPAHPGVLVAVPLDEVLPVGAAPPGAMLVGYMDFDATGQPSSFRVQ